jgi:hypothetical protein
MVIWTRQIKIKINEQEQDKGRQNVRKFPSVITPLCFVFDKPLSKRRMEGSKHKVFAATRGFLCRDGRWTQKEEDATLFSDLAGVVQLCLRFGIMSVVFISYTGSTRVEWPLCFS